MPVTKLLLTGILKKRIILLPEANISYKNRKKKLSCQEKFYTRGTIIRIMNVV